MAKSRVAFVCQSCGSRFPKWLGRCPDCGGWNSVVEEVAAPSAAVLAFSPRPQGPQAVAAPPQAAPLFQREAGKGGPRLATGFGDVDRVLSGGLLEGSVVLLGGDPGIGKSILVLQMLDRVGARGASALYLSGEESPAQIQGRADRLELTCRGVHVLAETELERMAPEVEWLAPRLLVVDSIQTVRTQDWTRSRARSPRCGPAPPGWWATPRPPAPPWCWSATSPRRVPWADRAPWSTWWTWCCSSRARRTAPTACCAAPRTASAR